MIVLDSAREDGFDSLLDATEDLAEALRSTPGPVRLTWRELPATLATGADPDDHRG